MTFYDVFSKFYDASLEKPYRDARASALDALALSPGQRALARPVRANGEPRRPRRHPRSFVGAAGKRSA